MSVKLSTAQTFKVEPFSFVLCWEWKNVSHVKTEATLLNSEAAVSRTTAIIIAAGRGGEKVQMEWNSVCTSHPGEDY